MKKKKRKRHKQENKLKYSPYERSLFLCKYNYYNYRVIQSWCLTRNHSFCTESM